MPKILHFFHTLKLGGAQSMRLTIIKSLQTYFPDLNHEIISLQDGELLQEAEKLGVKIIVLENRWSRIFCLPKLINQVNKIAPDIIHSLPWVPNFFARLISKFFLATSPKIICDFHGTAHLGKLQHFLDRHSFHFADRWLFVTPELRNYFSQKWGGATNDHRLIVAPNFIEQRFLADNINQKQQAARQKLVLELGGMPPIFGLPDTFILGVAARLEPVKRLPMLIQYFADFKKSMSDKNKKLGLLIIGSGPLQKELADLVRSYQLADATYFGCLPRDKMPLFYKAIDALILGSESEGQPLVLMEAATLGTPILLSANLAAQSVLFMPQAPVYYFSDQSTFAKLATRLTKQQLPRQNYLKPEYFEENVVKVYAKIYDSLLNAKTKL